MPEKYTVLEATNGGQGLEMAQNVHELNWSKIVEALRKKMEFKGHTFYSVEQLMNPENDKQLSVAFAKPISLIIGS